MIWESGHFHTTLPLASSGMSMNSRWMPESLCPSNNGMAAPLVRSGGDRCAGRSLRGATRRRLSPMSCWRA